MHVPLVDLKAQYVQIQHEIQPAIDRVLEKTQFILGEEVERFEADFASFLHARGCVGVASGTAALTLSLAACGVGPGDEVIIPTHTFFATAEAVIHNQATPIFVDIDPTTYTLDLNQVEEKITPKTKAVIPVHLYGYPADMQGLMAIATKRGLVVIEDAAQAHGAKIKESLCGTIGHMGCFSFYPGKNLGAYGDAGAVVSNDLELLNRVRKLSNHGRIEKYKHDVVGYGERLDNLQAAILNVKLPHVPEWNQLRREKAELYKKELEQQDIVLPVEYKDFHHVYHLFVIRTENRDEMIQYLKRNGIDAGIHYPIPLHKQPGMLASYGDVFSLPIAEKTSREVLSLPIYPELSLDQLHHVCKSVIDFLSLSN
jgi:dTDP-4-amino-4,6-dideoxygalactose transaminase